MCAAVIRQRRVQLRKFADFFSDSLHGVEKYKARDQRARQTVDEGEVRQACKINHNCCFGGVSNNHILAIS